ncbi:NmrA family NAD(P)-binding protein [Pseudonocardia nematodicida]|uniref:NmrA family NAD(P)-binding protein n=1 Tax=Pseudonocardia nematodicida TaxID=1206997 RepID=A0ABV1K3U4_9PSEU
MSDPVLVAGATGKQGGAAARALRAAGTPVRALVRDPGSAAARALAGLGVEVVRGDLDDPASVVAAARGARGVFSVQMPDLEDLLGDREIRHARAIAAAVRETGVEQVVHTSVSGAGEHGRPGAVDPELWGAHMAHYWPSKLAAEEIVTGAGAGRTTVLRPSTFMENFVPPSMYLAGGDSAEFAVPLDADVEHPFVAVDDIGAAAAAAFTDPDRFDGVALELAGERLTFRQAVRTIGEAWGTEITVTDDPEAARASGLPEAFLRSFAFLGTYQAPAAPEDARRFGLPTTSLATWARSHPQTLRPAVAHR